MKHCYLSFAFILFLLVAACNEQPFFEANTFIKNRSWSKQLIPRFQVHIPDSSAKYDIWINIRHNNQYRYSNLFLTIHEKDPKGKEKKSSAEIKLGKADGRWIGKTAASLYEVQSLLKESYTFPDTGVYTFSIEHKMEDNPLPGVSDVGLKFIKK